MNTHKEPELLSVCCGAVVSGELGDVSKRWASVTPSGRCSSCLEMSTFELSGVATKEFVKEVMECEFCGTLFRWSENHTCGNTKIEYVEPTPPSQIEEESQTQRSLREMYELGKEHGRVLALKDIEIEKLLKEIGE